MQPVKLNFKVYQGSTFNEVLRWESSRKIYKAINAITQNAPCTITSTAHGVPDGWRVKVTNAGGMKEINSSDIYHNATKLTADAIELNAVNSLAYTTYTSGGVIEYNEPVTLTGYTARMQIRDKVDSDIVLKELTTENGGITIDAANFKINIFMSAADTALFEFKTAVYSIEMVSTIVVPLASGTLTLIKEITR